MAKYKQSYSDRKNESYGMKGMGVMGHDSKVYQCNAFAAQKKDLSKVDRISMDYRGTPEKAFGYKY